MRSDRRGLPLPSLKTVVPAAAGLALLAAAALSSGGLTASAAEEAWTLPKPAVDDAGTAGEQTALVAGGCFWGVQGVFQHVKGVTSAVSGYAGGETKDPSYEAVSTGTTGHAETVKITFDPKVVSYGELLRIYFSVAHDPTTLNAQGPDHGTQYRSAVFPVNDAQKRVADAYIAQLGAAKIYPAKIVTTTTPAASGFFPAEAYHQDFLAQNPTYPYIVYNDLPKVENLKRLFPAEYRADPVLVSAAKS
ncbi:peptide-methionine (S)-S-oxide reductase MsrA [Aureimonas leprariae]|uniref:Peptide methionine sulfoxide reductase MsrA n=1 Tax=Plantimonas leprariae TaxID=2615207 RepID=A0A7V7TVF1_9HYPH|nr:peptide-methionine (S)-S-oxide reductase MsrA [Aureimonas leprariae]KAB0677769.1 peptide-methionine (S)-S-oxide reductase MsrA [Aureimonas leprariae]